MNFDAPLLRPLRILLFPFSFLYGCIIWVRNRLFDTGIFSGSAFNLPLICVGNLAAGGTGKSPMVEYLLTGLQDKYRIAVLSRGYKRKTSGYVLATKETTALEIGDEPMLIHDKFPGISVAVGEQRMDAIPQLLHDRPETEAIILDDAFQHRSVKAGLNILLTDIHNLFTRDWFLPTGHLRDEKSSYRRADILVVTKCHPDMDEKRKAAIEEEIKPLPHQRLFFSTINYGDPYHLLSRERMHISDNIEVLLVSGIANPRPLRKYVDDHAGACQEMRFRDHHIFSIDDWKGIVKKFNSLRSPSGIILTTEKDAVRLLKFRQDMAGIPVFVIPISVDILFGESHSFRELVHSYIGDFIYKKKMINA